MNLLLFGLLIPAFGQHTARDWAVLVGQRF